MSKILFRNTTFVVDQKVNLAPGYYSSQFCLQSYTKAKFERLDAFLQCCRIIEAKHTGTLTEGTVKKAINRTMNSILVNYSNLESAMVFDDRAYRRFVKLVQQCHRHPNKIKWDYWKTHTDWHIEYCVTDNDFVNIRIGGFDCIYGSYDLQKNKTIAHPFYIPIHINIPSDSRPTISQLQRAIETKAKYEYHMLKNVNLFLADPNKEDEPQQLWTPVIHDMSVRDGKVLIESEGISVNLSPNKPEQPPMTIESKPANSPLKLTDAIDHIASLLNDKVTVYYNGATIKEIGYMKIMNREYVIIVKTASSGRTEQQVSAEGLSTFLELFTMPKQIFTVIA